MTPNTQEYNSVDDVVDCTIEDLVARDICFIEDVDAIDEKFFLALGNVLAGVAAAEFGLQNDQAIAARAIKGEQDLERISATRPTYETLEIMPY